jgi:hypothetical protein
MHTLAAWGLGRGCNPSSILTVDGFPDVDAFHKMLRQKTAAALNPWIECARESLIASFANGVARDEAAMRMKLGWPSCAAWS